MRVAYCQMALLLLWQKQLAFFLCAPSLSVSSQALNHVRTNPLLVAVIFNPLYLVPADQRLGELSGGQAYRKVIWERELVPF